MNDIEKAIEYFNTQKELFPNSYNALSGYFDLAIQALQEQAEHRWIPVTERLPLPDKMVLCYQSDGVIETGYYYDYNWTTGNYPKCVTHWMPLPKPPKEDK